MSMTFDGSIAMVVPPTEIDIATAEELHRDLAMACVRNPERVIVDFAAVTFCDTQALKVLTEGAGRLAESGCPLELRNPPRMLRRIAAITGLSDRLGIPHIREDVSPT